LPGPDRGKGAKYMIAFTDSQGAPLSGASNYSVRVPWPEFPVQSVVHERRFRWLLCR
jgi:hypothetical protein